MAHVASAAAPRHPAAAARITNPEQWAQLVLDKARRRAAAAPGCRLVSDAEGGAVETLALLILREQDRPQVNLLVDKHRQGATGTVPLAFDKRLTRFEPVNGSEAGAA